MFFFVDKVQGYFDDGEVASCLAILDLNPNHFLQYGSTNLRQMRVVEAVGWFFDANVKVFFFVNRKSKMGST